MDLEEMSGLFYILIQSILGPCNLIHTLVILFSTQDFLLHFLDEK